MELYCLKLPYLKKNINGLTKSSVAKKSLDLIDAIFHTTDIGLAVIDENGYFLKTNDGYNALFGYENGFLNGKHYSITIPKEDLDDSQQILNNCFNGLCKNEDRLAVNKNGEYFYIYRTTRLCSNSDTKKLLVVTARNISETRKYHQLLQHAGKVSQLAGWEMEISSRKVTCTNEMFNIIELAETEFNKLPYEKMMCLFFEKETITKLDAVVANAVLYGTPFTIEIPLVSFLKNKKWLAITCTPERLRETTIRLIGTVQDITNRKQNELELERLSLVASKTNSAVFITDKEGKTIWLNDSVQKLTGFDPVDILGKKPGELLQGHGTDKATVKRIGQRLKKQLPFSETILNYRKDGSTFWINMDIAPVFKNNELENFIGIGTDITEIIKASEVQKIKDALEQQQKLFKAIANNFPNGIIGLLDNNLRYIFAGGTEVKKLGLTESDFIGNKIFDHLAEKSNKLAAPFLKRALAGENVVFEGEMKGETYSINAVPARIGDNVEKFVLVVLHNITINKKAETDLKETLRKEKELGELKTRFVSMASHEFRTPLSTVLSSAYLIEKYAAKEEQPQREKHLKRIISSVEMLTEILEDFLSLGKIEEGKIQVRPTTFNISKLLNKVLAEINNNLKPFQHIMYAHSGKEDVTLDPSLLKHILMNLVSNASKFSAEGRRIEVKSHQSEHQLTLSVKDQGIGITTEDQAHLMERFFRGANASNIQGTGLGLHIVSKYAELMHGKVKCYSELEKGTTFTINFDLKIN